MCMFRITKFGLQITGRFDGRIQPARGGNPPEYPELEIEEVALDEQTDDEYNQIFRQNKGDVEIEPADIYQEAMDQCRYFLI